MKKINFFRPVAKVVFAVLIASIVMVSCKKEAFNSKLKMGGKDGIDVLTTYTQSSDTTKNAQ